MQSIILRIERKEDADMLEQAIGERGYALMPSGHPDLGLYDLVHVPTAIQTDDVNKLCQIIRQNRSKTR